MGERKRRLAGGAAAVATPAVAATAPTAVDALLGHGAALQAQGRMQDAFKCFQDALAASPGHPAALAGLGATSVALGQVELGLGWLGMAATAQPDDAGIRTTLGQALAKVGRLKDAAAHLRAGLAVSHRAEDARDLAAVLVHLGETAEAEHWFAVAARQLPDRADLHEALASLQYQRNALEAAVASHRRAAELDPGLTRRLNIGFARHRPGTTPGHAHGNAAMKVRLPGTGAAPSPAALEPAALRAAIEDRSLLVLDDFLDDPLACRAHALALTYATGRELGAVNFPGIQTAAQECSAIMQRIADALGCDLKWDSPDNGAFRLSSAADTARCDIHVDSDTRADSYAAVLYLSLPEHCAGGTGFWRHRETGWERRPSAEQLRVLGYASFLDFERRWVPVGRQRPFAEWRKERAAAWDCVLEIPMRFNRMIVYRSDFFHAIGELFGDRPENARLVQLFYFQAVDQARDR
jgi:tetratricopeptide (TPR) repeat protein